MANKSIACIGQGFVGSSLGTVFASKGFDVYSYDKMGKYGENVTPCDSLIELVHTVEVIKTFSGIYFLCLPTPMLPDGDADLSIVESVLNELSQIDGERTVVVKSTVPPGSTERWNKEYTNLHIVFNPEFLVEATALHDMLNQTRIVLGGPRPWINKVKFIYQQAFPTVPIVKTSSTNAELTKYVTNCFLAMKVSFANEIYQICQKLDEQGLNADYDRVIECATLDPRLGTSHWRVPSFETDENGQALYGFSLSCFPKDCNALISLSKKIGVDPKMLSATWLKNLEVRPGKDWCKMLGRAVSEKK